MKKIICILLCVLFVMGFAGCGKSNGGNNNTDDYEVNLHPDTQTTATLRVACENYEQEKKIISDLGTLFKKQYPNVKIEIVPFSGAISSTYASWASANNMPDIFINNTFDMFTLSDKGILLNLDPYLNAEKEDSESDFDINDYRDLQYQFGKIRRKGRNTYRRLRR